jgi:hypothetical protein
VNEEAPRPGIGRILWDVTEILVLLGCIGGCIYCAFKAPVPPPKAAAPDVKGGPRGPR